MEIIEKIKKKLIFKQYIFLFYLILFKTTWIMQSRSKSDQ